MEYVTPTPPGERTRNIVLYGHTGTGKSTGAIKAPGPILYLNTEGEEGIETPRLLVPTAEIREVNVTGEQTLDESIVFLKDGGDGAKTVILDSFSEAYGVLLRAHAKDPKHPTQPEYGHVSSTLTQWLYNVKEIPVNVIVICHVLIVDEGGAPVLHPHAGTQTPGALLRLLEHVFPEVLAYCSTHEDQYMAQLVPANGRTAKDRTNALGKTQPLDLGAWIKTINNNKKKAATAKETAK